MNINQLVHIIGKESEFNSNSTYHLYVCWDWGKFIRAKVNSIQVKDEEFESPQLRGIKNGLVEYNYYFNAQKNYVLFLEAIKKGILKCLDENYKLFDMKMDQYISALKQLEKQKHND